MEDLEKYEDQARREAEVFSEFKEQYSEEISALKQKHEKEMKDKGCFQM